MYSDLGNVVGLSNEKETHAKVTEEEAREKALKSKTFITMAGFSKRTFSIL